MLKRLLAISLFVLPIIAQSAATAAPAKDFTLPIRNGGEVSLSKLKGQVVYVDFWATWCPPCRKSFPWMNEIQQRYANDGLQIVAINLDKEQAPVEKFLREMSPSFIIALDPEATTAERFDVQVMPTSFLVDRNGNVILTHRGFRNKDTGALEEKIKSLLAK